MKNKKLMSILLVGAILGSTLGAATVSAADNTSVSLWTWSPITRTAEKMIAAFEKANPDIAVDYTNYNYNPEYLQALSAASASDNLPDIVGLQPGSLTQTYSDYLIDLSDYAKETWGCLLYTSPSPRD